MIRQFYGMVLLFMLYCGTSLHAGVFLESTRYETGILFPNFFLTYLYATKVESKKSFTLKVGCGIAASAIVAALTNRELKAEAAIFRPSYGPSIDKVTEKESRYEIIYLY